MYDMHYNSDNSSYRTILQPLRLYIFTLHWSFANNGDLFHLPKWKRQRKREGGHLALASKWYLDSGNSEHPSFFFFFFGFSIPNMQHTLFPRLG